MEEQFMKLKILLPYKVFLNENKVSKVVLETTKGSYGILPQRLDCVAALVPGIFTYEIANSKPKYLALDEGIMVKTGYNINISVHNAIGGADLGNLHDLVKKEFEELRDSEKKFRQSMAKIESNFILRLKKFQKE